MKKLLFLVLFMASTILGQAQVSKMLGHTNITQTQVYAKILDTSKRKAVELLPTFD